MLKNRVCWVSIGIPSRYHTTNASAKPRISPQPLPNDPARIQCAFSIRRTRRLAASPRTTGTGQTIEHVVSDAGIAADGRRDYRSTRRISGTRPRRTWKVCSKRGGVTALLKNPDAEDWHISLSHMLQTGTGILVVLDLCHAAGGPRVAVAGGGHGVSGRHEVEHAAAAHRHTAVFGLTGHYPARRHRTMQNSYTTKNAPVIGCHHAHHLVNMIVTLALAALLDHARKCFDQATWHRVHVALRAHRDAVPPTRGRSSDARADIAGIIGDAWRQTRDFIRRERAFMRYQYWFFLYGCGFMSAAPLLIILVTDILHLSYVRATIILTVAPQLALLLLSPLVGKLYDRVNPILTMVWATLLLGFYSLSMTQCNTFSIALAAIMLYSVAMVGVMSWSLCGLYDTSARTVLYACGHYRRADRALAGVLALRFVDLHRLPDSRRILLRRTAGMWRLHRHRQLTADMLNDERGMMNNE